MNEARTAPPSPERPTVFLVDDDEVLREGLSDLLEAAGYRVAAFGCAEDLLAALEPATRGCLVLDVSLPGLQGPEVQAELARRGNHLPILFLTGSGDIPMAVQAIRTGARDVLVKPARPEVLLARVAELVVSDVTFMAARDALERVVASLTPREREVVVLVAEGLEHKDIGERLGISFRTVEVHRAHVAEKTGLSNLVELAGFVRSARAAKLLT